ncbi:uncharacterized protein F5Z01DRAFT_646102 [Emericellopsis atlantica]|uniref:Uncharacterized protein n=1 Tax=Emericellopsis atlantica TaxID=2614577 RepID=A0A9P7ZSG3_9HYPO|nr:uncharacterized protein F5Z01DRAFT_646102 [Emericellopsis atlantica]KAG9257498.1 hypothetical protein F5Z01DRAFT_646102 [Emericellopsis atlantica]
MSWMHPVVPWWLQAIARIAPGMISCVLNGASLGTTSRFRGVPATMGYQQVNPYEKIGRIQTNTSSTVLEL